MIFTACNQSVDQESAANKDQVLVSINQFYEHPEEFVGKEVTISGLVTHVCKHGGQKLFITGSESGEALRIDVGKNIPEFDIEMEGSEATFTGKIYVMDEGFVAQAKAEDKEHHENEEDCAAEKSIKDGKQKNFYLVAQNFLTK